MQLSRRCSYQLLVSRPRYLLAIHILICVGLHDEHPKYSTMVYAHEAGYDSLTTAKILIRLSAKLEAAGQYTDSEDDGWHTPSEVGGVLVDQTKIVSPGISAEKHSLSQDYRHQNLENGVCMETATGMHRSATEKSKSSKKKMPKAVKKKMPKAVKKKSRTTFSHPGRFDLLENIQTDEEGSNSGDLEYEYTEQTAVTDRAPIHHWEAPKPTPSKMLNPGDQPGSRLMPRWNSDFWNVYGNLLRVNGTVEGVCDLTGGASRR